MARERKDAHRPSAIEPADYEYRWAFDTASTLGPTAARFKAALRLGMDFEYLLRWSVLIVCVFALFF